MNIVKQINLMLILVLTVGFMPHIASAAAPTPAPAPTAPAATAAAPAQAPAQTAAQQQEAIQEAQEDLKAAATKLASEIDKLDDAVRNIGTHTKRRIRVK